MALAAKLNSPKVNFMLLQCLGWGTLFSINFFMMWLSGEGAWERSLNILVFLTCAVFCSFILRSLLKPIAHHSSLVKLTCLAALYSFIMATLTVQFGLILLAILPEYFGGQTQFNVNVFIIITLGWSMAFAIWSLCYLFIQRQRDLQLSKANESRLDALLTKARLNTLHSQINPHFIFNAINNIRALVLEDKAKSRDMLANLSDILRYSLESEQTSMVSLCEEMEVVNEYLELCQIQYERRLNVKIDVDKNCQKLLIPRMLIQMLVENGIKHGIAECIQPGRLLINIYNENDLITITVANTGMLKKSTNNSRQGIGLKNIAQRLQLIYKDKAKFIIEQKQELVVAKVTISLRQTDYNAETQSK